MLEKASIAKILEGLERDQPMWLHEPFAPDLKNLHKALRRIYVGD